MRSVYPSILSFFFFFFNDTATPEIYTLPLHDALPICGTASCANRSAWPTPTGRANRRPPHEPGTRHRRGRSEEHTSELQSQSNLVCRLLLEKKKIKSTKWDHAVRYLE